MFHVTPSFDAQGGRHAGSRRAERGGALFTYVNLEDELPKGSSAAGDPGDRDWRPGSSFRRLRWALLTDWTAVSSAGRLVASAFAEVGLLDQLGEPIDGAVGFQHAPPLVRGPRHRRFGMGRDDIQRERRPAADGRRGAALSRREG